MSRLGFLNSLLATLTSSNLGSSFVFLRVPNLPLGWTMFLQSSCLARFMPLKVKSLPSDCVKAR